MLTGCGRETSPIINETYADALSEYHIHNDQIVVSGNAIVLKADTDDGIITSTIDGVTETTKDEANVSNRVHAGIVTLFDAKLTNQVISVAKTIDGYDDIFYIDAHIAVDDKGKITSQRAFEDYKADQLDFHDVDIDKVGFTYVPFIHNAMVRIVVSSDMDDDQFIKFQKDLSEAICNTYGNNVKFGIGYKKQ